MQNPPSKSHQLDVPLEASAGASDVHSSLTASGKKPRAPASPTEYKETRKSIALGTFIVALLLISILVLALLSTEIAGPFALSMLGLFAVVGVFTVTAGAVGLLHFSQHSSDHQLAFGVLETVPWGAVVVDQAGGVLFANRAYRNLLQIPHPDARPENNTAISGRNNLFGAPVMRPEAAFSSHLSVAPLMYRLSMAAREGRVLTEELRLTASDPVRGISPFHIDTPRWFKVTVQPWQSHAVTTSPNVEALSIWQITDVTAERSRQDIALRRFQNTLQHLDNIPAGFFATGTDGHIDQLNRTLAEWLGINVDAVLPGSLSLSDIITADGAAMLNGFLPSCDPSGPEGDKKEGEHIQTFNLDLMRADGTRFPARLMHKVWLDEYLKVVCTRTLVVRGRSAEQLSSDGRDAERRFARFYHAAPFAIATISADGRIMAANAKFAQLAIGDRFGDEKMETQDASGTDGGAKSLEASYSGIIMGRTPLVEMLDTNSAEILGGALEEARQGLSEITPIEVVFRGKKNRLARLYAAPAGHSSEAAEGHDGEDLIVYALDTTAQKALEEQFAQSQKMQAVGQLAGGIAHDFNNVLTAIIGFSDLLLRNHRHTDPSFQDIMNIKQNAIRAAGLVRQLMAFSRQQTLRPEVLSLGDKLADLSIWLGRLLGERVVLHVHHGRDLWPVKADSTQFDQVIMNLAVNARDAMKDGGELTIRTQNISERESQKINEAGMSPGDYVLCEVSDTGCGMTEETAAKIFEPFFTTKKVGEGTGLGMSTVYGIVKQTGGFIYLDSRVGEGTTFRIFLPRHCPGLDTEPEPIEPASVPAKNQQSRDLTGSGTILLVEDEEAVRTFAARALTSRGYNVHEASNGVEALEIMARIDGRVDLVVSDVVMPEMDGPALLKALRKHSPSLQIIFMSGYAEDAFKRGLEEPDGFSFLAKPFTLKQLAETVKEALNAQL